MLYSAKTPEHIIYKNELQELKNKYSDLDIIITITRPNESNDEWHGLTGRITKELILDNIDELEKSIFFICGPPEMVKDTVNYLKELKVKNEQIKVEKW